MREYNEHLRVQLEEQLLPLVLVEGRAQAVLGEPGQPAFLEGLIELHRRERAGTIERFDHKVRFDGLGTRPVDPPAFVLRAGPTDFYRCARDIEDLERTSVLLAAGAAEGDPTKYLACGLGVAVALVSSVGRVLLGRRRGQHYDGHFHVPAGWVPFNADIGSIDVREHARVEVYEELGLEISDLRLLGVVSYRQTYETDVVFRADVDEHILSGLLAGGWRKASDAHEHDHLVLVDPLALDVAAPIVPSARYALDRIAEEVP